MSSEATGTSPSAEPSLAPSVILWVLSLLAAMFFLALAIAKLTDHAPTVAAFEAWGYGRTLLHVIGWVEAAGAVALVIPRLTTWAAALLSLEMVGAIHAIVTTGVGTLPQPLICLIVLVILGFHRRHRAVGIGAG